MPKRLGKFRPPLWLKRIAEVLMQIIVPLIIFQFFRTILFPSTFDVIILALLIGFYLFFVLGDR